MCIRQWIQKHYSDYDLIEIETNAVVNTRFSVIKELRKSVSTKDIIIFQSGYTTTDLGGYADEMHRVIMLNFPQSSMLMLPQTIFFKNKENRERTANIYNSMKNMLYLARDKVSYGMACEMFPDISVQLFPDIVTTLIGKYPINTNREGILFCLRNDGEKYYSDEELEKLIIKCKEISSIFRTDTTKGDNVVDRAKEYIESEIFKYSKYKIMITDRYHGTILSLVAGTPVIVLKTNDHKVVTGAQWFSGIYDKYVYLANNLDEAYELVKCLYHEPFDYRLEPYFEEAYYDKLPDIFSSEILEKNKCL